MLLHSEFCGEIAVSGCEESPFLKEWSSRHVYMGTEIYTVVDAQRLGRWGEVKLKI